MDERIDSSLYGPSLSKRNYQPRGLALRHEFAHDPYACEIILDKHIDVVAHRCPTHRRADGLGLPVALQA